MLITLFNSAQCQRWTTTDDDDDDERQCPKATPIRKFTPHFVPVPLDGWLTWWPGLAWLKVDEDEVVSICISYYYNSPHRSMHITLVIHSFRPPQPGHRYLWTVRSIDHSFSGHSFFLTWSGARGKLTIRSGEIHKFLEIKWKWGRELSRSFRTS